VQAYLVELEQDTATCGLKAISQIPTEWSAWGGLCESLSVHPTC